MKLKDAVFSNFHKKRLFYLGENGIKTLNQTCLYFIFHVKE